MKKLLLGFAMAFLALVSYADTAVVNGRTWTYYDYYIGGVVVEDVTPVPSGEFIIPSEINGSSVVAIGRNFMEGCDKITSVEIPTTVRWIESRAFSECMSLTAVFLPEGIEEIGDEAFVKCPLTSLELPSTLCVLGNGAFARSNAGTPTTSTNKGIRQISIRNGDNEYFGSCGGQAIYDKTERRLVAVSPFATSFVIPEGCEEIGLTAFLRCTALREITFPSTLKDLDGEAFAACTKLTKLDFSNTSLSFISEQAFCGCTSLTEVRFPATLTEIGGGAFCGANKLKSVTFAGNAPAINTNYYETPGEWGNLYVYINFSSEGWGYGGYLKSVTTYVSPTSTGWGKVPGTWQGCPIRYATTTEATTPDLGVLTKARTFNGHLMDDDQYVGMIWVKAAKARYNKKTGLTTSKFTATVQVLGEKKASLKGEYDLTQGAIAMTSRDGHVLSLEAEDDGVSFVGTYDAYDVEVVMDDGANRSYALDEGAAFCIDAAALSEMLGDDTYAEYLPDGIPVTTKGTKWSLPKAGKVVYNRKTGGIDESKLGENPSGLKLNFKSKNGTFTGSFKAYVVKNGKPKATAVSVSGFVVEGKGYGIATIKKIGSVAVTIEDASIK